MLQNILRPALFVATVLTASQTLATSAYIFPVKILQILTQSDDPRIDSPVPFGGCMARIDVDPVASGLNCTTWLSMSCDGQWATKSSAAANLSAAQLALVTKGDALVLINDAKTTNENFCFIERIDNVAEGATAQ